MTVAALDRKLKEIDVEWPAAVCLHCDKQRCEEFMSLLSEKWPNHPVEHLADTPAGRHHVKGRSVCTVGDRYFRAIAKIGFHYFLTHTKRGFRGDELHFGALRRFIRDGGAHSSFIHTADFSISDAAWSRWFARTVPDGQWCHILAMDETSSALLAWVHLFFGSESDFPGYRINLGEADNHVFVPFARRGHVYSYYAEQPEVGLAGDVHSFPGLVVPECF